MMNIPEEVLNICIILKENRYDAYLVGGCVRDMIMGREPKDFDLTTDALPEKVMELFPNNVPTGLKHGTVTIKGSLPVEITTYRTEGSYDGRKPNVLEFVTDIKEDLKRRDFTINAIAYDPITKEIIDPFNGSEDIENKIIRCVGDPNERFSEDGLRLLRALRFSEVLGFSIEEETQKSIYDKEIQKILHFISRERIRDEIMKILNFGKLNGNGLVEFINSGILSVIFPDLSANIKNGGLWLKSILISKYKLAAFFFPIKSLSNTGIRNVLHGDMKLPSEDVKKITRVLRCTITDVSNNSLKRLMIDHKKGIVLMLVDVLISRDELNKEVMNEIQAILESGVPLNMRELKITGDTLLNWGLNGKQIGYILQKLLYWASEDKNRNEFDTLVIKAKELNNQYSLMV